MNRYKMAQLLGEIQKLSKQGRKTEKSYINQVFFEYLECDFTSLFGPTNKIVHAHLPEGILIL